MITKKRKEYSVYLDATSEIYDLLDFPFNIDVIPHKAGKQLDRILGIGVLGANEVLYGDGSHLQNATSQIRDYLISDNPTFEEAKSHLRGAKRHMELAEEEEIKVDRDREIRDSFNSLFHASRIASAIHLFTDETRWGEIKRKLPEDVRREFSDFINILHIKYFYGEYPENVREEFDSWYGKVEGYVRGLEGKGVNKN